MTAEQFKIIEHTQTHTICMYVKILLKNYCYSLQINQH